MKHRLDAGGYCACGVRRLEVPGRKRGWWLDAEGRFVGDTMPACTRKPRQRPQQLKLFPVVANGNGGNDDG